MNEFFTSGDARLAYQDSGLGLPVFFLHPTPLDGEFWRPMLGHLAGVRAIVPDFRSHGASALGTGLPVGLFAPVPDAPALTMEQLADDVFGLMDHLELPQAVFVGCSVGGYAMLEMFRQAPQRMRGLAFICSKPQPDAPANHEKRIATIAQARAGAGSTVFDGMAQTLIGATTRRARPEVVRELRARMTLTADALVAVQTGLAVRPDSLPTVGTIRVPVLSIAGGEDPGVTPAEMEAFRAAQGTTESHVLPEAGHFAAYEWPEKTAALVGAWLRQFAG
ncbi:MAG TPA: alpha/beta hydrolase [Terracidiphilus sp.]|jgi:3-oxoadipate enol-lactonase|nr:alpha/beta hydrolase [Terracidiphilus sp.]